MAGALRHAGAKGFGVHAQVREHLPVPEPCRHNLAAFGGRTWRFVVVAGGEGHRGSVIEVGEVVFDVDEAVVEVGDLEVEALFLDAQAANFLR